MEDTNTGQTQDLGTASVPDSDTLKFGEWVVLGPGGTKAKLLCQCSCGTIREVGKHDLLKGKSTSCGHGKNKAVDLTGKTFGYWTVLKYAGNRKWICRCEKCKTEKTVTYSNLVNGKSKSCGCDCGTDSSIPILNERFGSLVPIKKLPVPGNKYLCQCDCGRQVEVYKSNLLRKVGGTRSCGCMFYENGAKTRMENGTTGYREDWQIQVLKSAENFESYLRELENKPTVSQLSSNLNIKQSEILYKIHNYKLEDLVELESYSSSYEDELIEYIKTVYAGEVKRWDRTILDGYELDLYIPDKNLAIEFNGSYWHSDVYKSKKYHVNKTYACARKGIRLIHIFEYEWLNDNTREKIKYYIANIISNETARVVYGRSTKVVEISSAEANTLYNKYHLQGGLSSSINLGLYSEDELIGAMSFSVPRFNTDYEWELSRLCFKPSVRIIGGSEKLLKYFIKVKDPTSIVCFCNIAKFTGAGYRDMGFKLEKVTEPNYVWVNARNEVLTRYQTQKHKLKELGWVVNEDDTEDSVMKYRGYNKVYDCGNMKFTWSKSQQ